MNYSKKTKLVKTSFIINKVFIINVIAKIIHVKIISHL